MPSVRQPATINKLAQAFTSNGRKQEQAMIDVGYSKAYANSYCGKLWEDKRLIEAIRRIDAKAVEKLERTAQQLDDKYCAAYDLAKQSNQPSAMVSAVTGIARLYGLDKDNDVGLDKPAPIPTHDLESIRLAARQAIKLKIG